MGIQLTKGVSGAIGRRLVPGSRNAGWMRAARNGPTDLVTLNPVMAF
jgi:hypothetical protein